jgi:hypothetical protein
MSIDMNSIPSKDISIIIQGPLYKIPKYSNHTGITASLPMIKKYFPDAEIVISTWENEDIVGLEVDQIIQSKDPQGFLDSRNNPRNFNRQIVSTRNGILHASRPYVLKTRADILFTSAEIAQVAQKKSNSLLNAPITMTNMIFRNYFKIPFLFHPSDVVHFGLKEDVLDLWDIPLEEYDEIAINRRENIFDRYISSFKYTPEQSLCIRWLKKHGINIALKIASQINKELLKIWESIIIENFHIVNYDRSGIIFPYHFYTSAYGVKTLLRNEDVLYLSKIQDKKGIVFEKLRYIRIWFNKYVLCFFKKIYLLYLVANMLYALSPAVHQKVFLFYRKIKPR